MNDVLLDGKSLWVQKHDETGWIFIHWKTHDLGHLPLSFIRELNQAEDLIQERKDPGWFCSSEKNHETMHRIIEKKGGVRVAEENGLVWFRKQF